MMLPFVGRQEEGLECLQRALAVALDEHDLRGETVRVHVATALTRMGRAPEARPHAVRALEITHQTGDWYLEAVCAWMAAEMEDALGDLDAAKAMRRREINLLARIGGNTHNEALSHAHLAHLARLSNDAESAACEAELARALAKADSDPGYLASLHVESWSDIQTG